MATENTKTEALSVESRLKSLYELQTILTEIDRIKTIRGELPLEVKDLEDNLAGLHTRIENYKAEIAALNDKLVKERQKIVDSQSKIATYKEQLDNVRNNREFDLLTKEVEFQTLEIELGEKHVNDYSRQIENKTAEIKATEESIQDTEHVLAESVPNSRRLFPKPVRTRSASVSRPRSSSRKSTPIRSMPSSASAKMPATAWVLSTSSATPAAAASTASPRRSSLKSRCTRKSSSANTAAASSLIRKSPALRLPRASKFCLTENIMVWKAITGGTSAPTLPFPD